MTATPALGEFEHLLTPEIQANAARNKALTQPKEIKMLTADERKTLNDAMAIIERCSVVGASWQFSARQTSLLGFWSDMTYFDSRPIPTGSRIHSSLPGETFADKVQAAIDIEAALPSPEETRAARAEALRRELAELERAA